MLQDFRKWARDANDGRSTQLSMCCHFSVGAHFYDELDDWEELVSPTHPHKASQPMTGRVRLNSTMNLNSGVGMRTSSVVHGEEKKHGIELFAPVSLEMEGDTVQIVCQKGECTFSMAVMGSVLRFMDFISFGYFNLDALNKYHNIRSKSNKDPGLSLIHI